LVLAVWFTRRSSTGSRRLSAFALSFDVPHALANLRCPRNGKWTNRKIPLSSQQPLDA